MILKPWKTAGYGIQVESKIVAETYMMSWALHKTKIINIAKKENLIKTINGIDVIDNIRIDDKISNGNKNISKLLELYGLGQEDINNVANIHNEQGVAHVTFNLSKEPEVDKKIEKEKVINHIWSELVNIKKIEKEQNQNNYIFYDQNENIIKVKTYVEKIFNRMIEVNNLFDFEKTGTIDKIINGNITTWDVYNGLFIKQNILLFLKQFEEIESIIYDIEFPEQKYPLQNFFYNAYKKKILGMEGVSENGLLYTESTFDIYTGEAIPQNRYIIVEGLKKNTQEDFVEAIGLYANVQVDAKKCHGFVKCFISGIFRIFNFLIGTAAKLIYNFPGFNKIFVPLLEKALQKIGGMSKEEAKIFVKKMIEIGLIVAITVMSGGSTLEIAMTSISNTVTKIQESKKESIFEKKNASKKKEQTEKEIYNEKHKNDWVQQDLNEIIKKTNDYYMFGAYAPFSDIDRQYIIKYKI